MEGWACFEAGHEEESISSNVEMVGSWRRALGWMGLVRG
jgi:hypothetical protein